jgi:hypothetical protein
MSKNFALARILSSTHRSPGFSLQIPRDSNPELSGFLPYLYQSVYGE